jgi:phage terminase large subunit GpA-like protein
MTTIAPQPQTTSAIDHLGGARLAIQREHELRRQIFRPPPKLTVSEWADRHRYLSGLSSAEEGRWRTSRAPFQRGIMDAISDPVHQTVIWVAPSQVGKSEILLNTIGYFIDQDPSPMLMVRPSIEDARDFSEDRIKAGLIETSPRVRARVAPATGRREAGNKMLRKKFPGGHLTLVGANSATGLANRPIRVVLFDEVDKYPKSAGDKGDPISLATNRTKTFWNRKIVKVTTPGVKGASRIEPDWVASDQRRYFVPCPHCKNMQHLQWANVDFDTGCYVCAREAGGCGVLIEERHKPWMLEHGEWRATNPDGKFPGFHLNVLYSPWTTWAEVVEKFKTAKKSPDTLQPFINEDLAEWWDPQDGDALDTETLAARREVYPAEVPAGVGVLVGFVDAQREWLELLVKGYGAAQESWLIAHHRIRGDTKQDGVWDRLDPLLLKGYQHESGATLFITICGVDSGDGDNVQPVYKFVAPRQRRARCPVYATKGSSVRGRPIIAARPSKKNKYGVRVHHVGTDTAKDIIFPRLRLKRADSGECPPGYMHFPRAFDHGGADDEYLEQFGRERVFIKHSHGIPYRVYDVVPAGARNEAIDLEVGCLRMLHELGAGVYDQLGAWAKRVNDEGTRIRKKRGETPVAAAATTDNPPPDDDGEGAVIAPPVPNPAPPPRAQPPRRPPSGGGWVNKWRR